MRKSSFVAFLFVLFLLFLGIRGIWPGSFTFELQGPGANLRKVVEQALQDSQGTYSVAIKNLKTGEEYYREADRHFDAGSLYKLWVALAVLESIEKGEISPDETLVGRVLEINKILGVSGEDAELQGGEVEFTVKSALAQMIEISHNYAAVLLTQKVTSQKVQQSLNNLGLKNTLIETEGRPKTTARDLSTFLGKVYEKKDVSASASAQLVDLLASQKLNDKIPKYLPNGIRVAHKTGEIDFQEHDAGIVFAPFGDYITVVLSETDSPTAAAERIANLSKEVYEYFKLKEQK